MELQERIPSPPFFCLSRILSSPDSLLCERNAQRALMKRGPVTATCKQEACLTPNKRIEQYVC